MLYKSKTFNPGFNSYPADVLRLSDSEIIGTASNATEYVSIWNSDTSNGKIGRLYLKTGVLFTLVMRGIGCASCYDIIKPIVPGCGPGSGGNTITLLDDLKAVVDADGPPGGVNTWLLPLAWKDKRFRMFRNGLKFFEWAIISGTPQDTLMLTTPGDMWMGTDENGAGFEEKLSLENY